ncbi:ferrous iron transporter B [Schaalia sp. 19OD2882]|uniref:ferrous iron transporter B n=1 Tax=Schaalia sp. 19OD2882 TaxID=2794089 RepID=UPI001C1EAC9B|nr:ferrous iron transporter B [Schaalia sp. 19OD2882]QWW19849.1 ferrous iron transporter B [Schaalia sp. 19OD2882]
MSCSKCRPGRGTDLVEEENADTPQNPTVLLIGNPNVGKSTLFNTLTGARQAVVNAPGTTVEVMQGTWSALGARLLDLPGTYSLIATSPDEQVVVDTLAGAPGSFTDAAKGRSVDLALVVLDATALTRSLYLVAQVARTGRPVATVITLADVQEREGESIDSAALSASLGVPVMIIDPRTSAGVAGLEDMVRLALCRRPRVKHIRPVPDAPGYNQVAAAAALAALERAGAAEAAVGDRGRDLLALNPSGCGCSHGQDGGPAGGCMAPDSTASAAAALHRSPQDEADDLFSWVERVDTEAFGVRKASTTLSLSDKIDRFLLHPVVGIPVFFALMWLLFKVAGEWVGPVQDLFDGFFTSQDEGAWSLANALDALLFGVGLHDTWVQGLLVGGLSTGLGVVASFLPLMFVIFLLISILEDSGYMARAAFLGDRVMRAIGLDGRVILPLIMGFGCNLPSLAATRTLPDAKQRLVTTLVIPYTSCAARLTIYLMIARIFFPAHTGSVVFVMYVFSLVMVILGALVLKPFITKDSSQAPLMLVLPAYQAPRVLVTVKNTAMRAWAFVAGAGKIIIVMTLVVWLMGAIPVAGGYSFAQSDLPMDKSLYGRTAQILEPVFAPAGFGEWHLTGALMTGFVAKETVISSIVTSYNLDPAVEGGDAEDGGEDLGSLPELVTGSFAASAGDAAPIAAFAFLVFVLTYTPCLATVAEQARQIGGRRTAAAVAVQFGAAWLLATLIFQAGRLVL